MGRLLANALFERIEGAYDGPARKLAGLFAANAKAHIDPALAAGGPLV